jgi:hypothetical protein
MLIKQIKHFRKLIRVNKKLYSIENNQNTIDINLTTTKLFQKQNLILENLNSKILKEENETHFECRMIEKRIMEEISLSNPEFINSWKFFLFSLENKEVFDFPFSKRVAGPSVESSKRVFYKKTIVLNFLDLYKCLIDNFFIFCNINEFQSQKRRIFTFIKKEHFSYYNKEHLIKKIRYIILIFQLSEEQIDTKRSFFLNKININEINFAR